MELHPNVCGEGRFVSPHELAKLARVRPTSIYRYMRIGMLPAPEVHAARFRAWRFETVEPWLAQMAKLPADAHHRAKAKAAKDAAKVAFGWTEGGAE